MEPQPSPLTSFDTGLPTPNPLLGAGLPTPPRPSTEGLQISPTSSPLGAGLPTPPKPLTEGLQISPTSSPHEVPPVSAKPIIPDHAHLEALAEFAAGAGHEINNPLATIIGRAQQLLKDEQDPQRRQMLQSIGAQAYRVRDMIGDAMLFGRPPKPALQVVNMAAAAAQVVSGLKDALAVAKCNVDISVASEIELNADPAQLAIVLSELIRNSRQALLPTGGTIYVRSTPLEPGFIQVEVEDQGCGFTDLERKHAFDPFYSGRQAGRGLGFGLPKCWQIIRMHGGTIQIDSPPGGPTVVRVKWPMTPTC